MSGFHGKRRLTVVLLGAALIVMILCDAGLGQQVTIGLPQQNISDGYFEYIGGGWQYAGPGFFLQFGPPPPPAFGGFDPASGLSGSWTFGTGGRRGRMYFSALSGRNTVYTSTTPYLTVTNGVPGHLFVGRTVPFVTGVIPTAPLGGSPLFDPSFQNLGAANSIAGRIQRGAMHLRHGQVLPGPDPDRPLPPELQAPLPPPAAIDGPRLGRDAWPADQPLDLDPHPPLARPPATVNRNSVSANEAARLLEKGEQLEAEGKPGAARLLYQTALRSADGELRARIKARLEALSP